MRRKLLWSIAGVLALATIVSVAIHVAPVRALLGMKPLGTGESSAFCPFGYGKKAPTATTARAIPTTPRPALGFALDVTTRADIDAWARANSVACVSQHRDTVRECTTAATSLWFRFDGATLAGIQTVRRMPTAGDVVTAFGDVETAMTATVGDPAARTGIADASDLQRGALRQAMVEYRAPAYRAVVRATNMGDGYVLTESYAN